jgi:hypothetical protein
LGLHILKIVACSPQETGTGMRIVAVRDFLLSQMSIHLVD